MPVSVEISRLVTPREINWWEKKPWNPLKSYHYQGPALHKAFQASGPPQADFTGSLYPSTRLSWFQQSRAQSEPKDALKVDIDIYWIFPFDTSFLLVPQKFPRYFELLTNQALVFNWISATSRVQK